MTLPKPWASRTSPTSHTSATSTSSATSATSRASGCMTDAEAAWVREHAWTKAMRKTYRSTPAVLTMCPCEYGPCGNCSAGHHADCPYDQPSNAQWAADRADVAAGWLTWPDKGVPNLGGVETWQVWETGIRHDGRCNCYLAGHHGALNKPLADPHQGQQTSIYDFLNPATEGDKS